MGTFLITVGVLFTIAVVTVTMARRRRRAGPFDAEPRTRSGSWNRDEHPRHP